MQVVVVDNFSSATSARRSRRCARNTGTTCRPPDNRGFGAGSNAGLARAAALGCDCFVLLNPDCRIDARTLSALDAVLPAGARRSGDPAPGRTGGSSSSPVHSCFSTADASSAWFPPTSRRGGRQFPSLRRSGASVAAGDLPSAASRSAESTSEVSTSRTSSTGRTSISAFAVGRRRVTRHPSRPERGARGGRHPAASRPRALSPRYYYWNCRNRLVFAAQHLPRRSVVEVDAVDAGAELADPPSWRATPIGAFAETAVAAVRGSLAGLVIAGRCLVCRSTAGQLVPSSPEATHEQRREHRSKHDRRAPR